MAIQDQRELELEEMRQRGIVLRGLSFASSTATGSNDNLNGMASAGPVNGLEAAKIQYIRQMVFQYLTCTDIEVKLHMETALMAIFRYNDTERNAIDEKRKENAQDTLTHITTFLGSLPTFSSP